MKTAAILPAVSEIRYSSQLESLGDVRTELKRRLQASCLGGDAEAVDGLLLAAIEAVANVIEHAHLQDGRPARVELESGEAGVELRIYDSGTEAPPDLGATSLPDPLAEGGRGLFLVDALTDEATSETSPDGEHMLRLFKRCAGRSA